MIKSYKKVTLSQGHFFYTIYTMSLRADLSALQSFKLILSLQDCFGASLLAMTILITVISNECEKSLYLFLDLIQFRGENKSIIG